MYIRVDRACDSLLKFHERKTWRAKKGYHGSAAPHAAPGRGRTIVCSLVPLFSFARLDSTRLSCNFGAYNCEVYVNVCIQAVYTVKVCVYGQSIYIRSKYLYYE